MKPPSGASLALLDRIVLLVVVAISAISLVNVAKSSNNISTLLTNGKTSSAISAKQAKESAARGEQIVSHVESQLDELLNRSDSNRQLICSIAQAVHLSSPIITADCS